MVGMMQPHNSLPLNIVSLFRRTSQGGRDDATTHNSLPLSIVSLFRRGTPRVVGMMQPHKLSLPLSIVSLFRRNSQGGRDDATTQTLFLFL